MTDLTTTYLGLNLKNPLVASASPLSKKADHAKKLEDAGVSAIVMYSLFEEQIIHDSLELDHYLTRGTNSFAEAITYLPDLSTYNMGPERYLDHLSSLKKTVSIPVIGSLNGVAKGGWTHYARLMQEAGADAVELNMYYLSADPDLNGQELEDNYVDLVAEVKDRRGRRPGAVQPLLPARFRPGRTGSRAHARTERFSRPAPAIALDFDPAQQNKC